MLNVEEYQRFLASKVLQAPEFGFADVTADDVTEHFLDGRTMYPHARDCIMWAVRGGRRALFESFGLQKTIQQLEIARIILRRNGGGRFLIVCPLNVVNEFVDTARTMLGITIRFIRSTAEASEDGIYVSNYESIRDEKIDPLHFVGASLDEAAILRGMVRGSNTYRSCLLRFAGMKYKFVATATPSPNDYIELLAYAAYLEVGDPGQIKTRFFKRNSEEADNLTLHPHKKKEFFLWLATWATFLQKPSDLGYSDIGYDLPPIEIHWHELPGNYEDAGHEVDGQMRMIKNPNLSAPQAAKERRTSIDVRIAKMMELRALDPSAHRLLWHDLEDERRAIQRAIPGVTTIWGSGTSDKALEDRNKKLSAFSHGQVQELATKPMIAGQGNNFQEHCAWAIYVGLSFKFNDFIQSIMRIQRFGQSRTVRIDLIYTADERGVREALQRKWRQHEELVQEMADIIREYGLAQAAVSALKRSMGTERIEARGETIVAGGANWMMVNNDCVLEMPRIADNSVDLILTSIPFSSQYEYSPNWCDFGNSSDNHAFFRQMAFLTPELLRVLKPGRLALIHVKDRIIPGGINGLGFQTAYRFHSKTADHFEEYGFAYLGMKTIVTDVVRENNQTYRLGWSEQCKDGTKMGVGMPEYLLMFRKAPSENLNSYADEPVVKHKPLCVSEDGELIPFDRNRPIHPGTGYSRSRWQIDAHGFTRSSGDRQLMPEDLDGQPHDVIFRMFREYSRNHVYNFEHHVRLCEHLEGKMALPVTFMLLQPQSWSNEVWSDITRMLGMNTLQAQKGAEQHLCPLQWDIADRCIEQFTMPGELVFDPFAGLGTVPYRAVLKGRRGLGVELSPKYFLDSLGYLKAAEKKVSMPGLFDLIDLEEHVSEVAL